MTTDRQYSPSDVSDAEVAQKVREVVATALELETDDVHLDSSLFELGAESLDLLDMAFMLETEYQIQFPRTDILERANRHFGDGALVVDGKVTDLGLKLLRVGMPELDPAVIKPGLSDLDVARMITVGSFVRITERLLEVKAAFPRTCEECGGTLVESAVMPEFECSGCQRIVAVPSGDDVLLEDLLLLNDSVQDPG